MDDKAIIEEATNAVAAMSCLSDDLERILNDLPKSASKKLRDALVDIRSRTDEVVRSLAAELDKRQPDHESLSIKAHLGKRAMQILKAGALAGAIVGGSAQAVATYQSLTSETAAIETHLDAVIDCYKTLDSMNAEDDDLLNSENGTGEDSEEDRDEAQYFAAEREEAEWTEQERQETARIS